MSEKRHVENVPFRNATSSLDMTTDLACMNLEPLYLNLTSNNSPSSTLTQQRELLWSWIGLDWPAL